MNAAFFAPKNRRTYCPNCFQSRTAARERAFFRNAGILAEPEIGITVSRLRIPIINKKSKMFGFFSQLDADRMETLVDAWNKKRKEDKERERERRRNRNRFELIFIKKTYIFPQLFL